MRNEQTHTTLVNEYNRLTYTHNYVFGYKANGIVYGARVMNADKLLTLITCLDCASKKNGGTIQLKYKPNKEQTNAIIANAVEIKPICTEEELEKEKENTKYNRGQIFENKVAEKFFGVQVKKKNAKFTDCGDVIIKEVHYQVKYLKATFTDEKTIGNLRSA